jgi:hypothetical protein
MDLFSLFKGRPDHPQGRSISGCRQSTGIAVGENVVPVLNQRPAVDAYFPVNGDIFFTDADGFIDKRLFDRIKAIVPGRKVGFETSLHPLDTPEEISRCRSRPGELRADVIKCRPEFLLRSRAKMKRTEGDPHRRCNPDGRGASNRQIFNGRNDFTIIPADKICLLKGQGILVDHDHGVVFPENRSNGL